MGSLDQGRKGFAADAFGTGPPLSIACGTDDICRDGRLVEEGHPCRWI